MILFIVYLYSLGCCIYTVLSVRFKVGVSLLLAPAGAEKRAPKAPFPLVGYVGMPPRKFWKSGSSGKMISSDLRQKNNGNTQAFIIYQKKRILLHSSRQSHVYYTLFSVVYILLR